MAYTPIHERILPSMIYYLFICAFTLFMTIRMFSKWRERKTRPVLLMTLTFLVLGVAIFALTGGLIETVITGYFMEFYRFSLPFAYSCVVVADIFLWYFSREITNKESKALIPVIIVGVLIIILLSLPINYWGVPSEEYQGKLNIRTYSTIALVVFSYVVYLNIAIICYKTKKEAPNKIAEAGFSYLFYAMICLMLFFAMVIGDTILILAFGHIGYSEFLWIGWGFVIGFCILSYFSLVMPDWLRKRIDG